MTTATDMEATNGAFWIDGWHVRPSLNRLERDGETAPLEPRIMEVLVCLARAGGEVVTREALIDAVWPDVYVGDDPLNRAISELRKAFGDDARHPRFIETIRTKGYRLVAPVHTGEAPPSQATPEAPKHLPRWATVAAIGVVAVTIAAWWLTGGVDGRATPGLKPARTTSFPGLEYDPAFSPSGEQIVFSWNGPNGDNFDVYVKLLGAETPLRLTADAGRDGHPAWSPDGQHVAFTRVGDDGCTLWMVPAIGGPERRLGACHDPFRSTLTWSADGSLLAYVERASTAAPQRIAVVDPVTLAHRPLTDPPAHFLGDGFPAFSPDGTRLAFVRTSSTGIENIFTMPAGGGTPRQLTHDNQRIFGVAWLDDTDLVFASDRDGTFSLWRLSSRGGAPQWMLTGGDSVISPTVDHAHGRVVYVRQVLDKNIWEAPLLATGGPPHVLIASTRWDFAPDLSAATPPRIAFVSNRTGTYEVWMAGADGSDPVPLTSFGGTVVGAPRWSPAGRHVAFDARSAQNADVYVVAAEGGRPRRLTTHPADDVAARWSRDGQRVYFASSRSGQWEVWRIPAAGGEAHQVTQHGGFAAMEAPDGEGLFFTRRDSAGLWLLPGDGGDERRVLDRLAPNDWGNWYATDGGVYFLDRMTESGATIAFLDLATGQVTAIADAGSAQLTNPGLSLSPDGQSAVYVQIDHIESDLLSVTPR